MNSLWMHAWRARADDTVTDEQKDMVKAQAKGLTDGRQTMADARAAVAANTATTEQLCMVQAQADVLADGRKKQADARAAVAAGTATEEQMALWERMAADPKAFSAKAAAAAVAAGRPMRRCDGAACTKIGPEGRQHKHYANGQERFCGRYRLPV